MLSATDIEREDRPAFVRFESRPIEDKQASLQAGRVVYKDVHYALITPPYSKDCVEHKVDSWFQNAQRNVTKGRMKPEWLEHWRKQYDAWKKGHDEPLDGTDVRNWSAITPAQVKNLISAGCRTIEDLAAANDQGMRAIGMGAQELKRKAKAYLQAANDHGPLVMMNSELQAENEQLKGTIESLQAQLSVANAALQNQRAVSMTVEDDDSITMDDITDNEISTLEEAREAYFQAFGKRPHHLMKLETIKKELG